MAHVPKPRTTLTSRTDVRTLRRGVKRYTRPRYLKYNCYSDEIQQIQNLLQNPKYGDCSYIAYYHKFPSSTVRTWKSKIQHDPNYNIQVGYKSKRRSIFTKEEEVALADYIRVNIIDTGQLFTDQDFRVLCMQAFLEKYQDAESTHTSPPYGASPLGGARLRLVCELRFKGSSSLSQHSPRICWGSPETHFPDNPSHLVFWRKFASKIEVCT